MNVEVLPDSDALAERAVEVIASAATRALDERGVFVWAVSGGSTPRRMLELLASRPDLDWSRMHLFQVDERIAPDGDPSRNATMLDDALLSPLSSSARRQRELAGLWLMPVTDDDLDAAADRYARTLNERCGAPVVLDLVQLGLGDDGHTASLVPGDPVLEIVDRDVAITDDYRGHRRMTLTWPVLDRAKEQLWVIGGASKRPAVARYLDNDPGIPATLPTQARATVLVDAAAYPSSMS